MYMPLTYSVPFTPFATQNNPIYSTLFPPMILGLHWKQGSNVASIPLWPNTGNRTAMRPFSANGPSPDSNEASFLFVLVGVDADNLVIIVMMGSWTAADVDARDGTEHDG